MNPQKPLHSGKSLEDAQSLLREFAARGTRLSVEHVQEREGTVRFFWARVWLSGRGMRPGDFDKIKRHKNALVFLLETGGAVEPKASENTDDFTTDYTPSISNPKTVRSKAAAGQTPVPANLKSRKQEQKSPLPTPEPKSVSKRLRLASGRVITVREEV